MTEDRDNPGRMEEVLDQVTAETGSLSCATIMETNKTHNRRGILGAIGGVIASLPIGTQLAGAQSSSEEVPVEEDRLAEQRRVLKKYDSPQKAREAITNHGSKTVAALAKEGLLDSGSVADLNVESLWNPAEFATSEEGVKVSGATVAGTPTAHIQVAKQTTTHRVVLIVQPEVDRSYAIIKDQNSDSQLVTATNSGVEPVDYCVANNHCVADFCSSNPLVDNFTYREVYCCQNNPCYFGEDLGCCVRSTESDCGSFC